MTKKTVFSRSDILAALDRWDIDPDKDPNDIWILAADQWEAVYDQLWEENHMEQLGYKLDEIRNDAHAIAVWALNPDVLDEENP